MRVISSLKKTTNSAQITRNESDKNADSNSIDELPALEVVEKSDQGKKFTVNVTTI